MVRSNRPTTRAHVESLEIRSLLSAVAPSNYETYMVELINRARANPSAEASRYGIALNEGVPADKTISTAAKQPLVINPYITDAARKHSQWMIDTDTFSHTGSGGTNPGTRVTNAGYTMTAPSGWGENIAWSGSTPSVPNTTTTTAALHQNLFVDSGYPNRGHRTNMMSASFKEVGAGVVTGVMNGYNAVMGTTDFGYTAGNSFLTGVAYTDAVAANSFYDVGEGMGSVLVKAVRTSDNATFQTTTWSSGAYRLQVPAGTYTVTASGGSLSGVVTYSNVAITDLNVKRDFKASQATNPNPTATLSAAKLTRGGMVYYNFTVRYNDDVAVDVSDIDNSDILVTGPKSFSVLASKVKVDINTDGTPRTATYRFAAPGGFWNSTDNGTYTVRMQSGQVSDTSNNFVPAATLGTFKVSMVSGSLPTAAISSAPTITAAGATTYRFSITYGDNSAVDVSDFDSSDLTVTGPTGNKLVLKFISSSSTDGTPRKATYEVTAPGGTWGASDNGTYTITMNSGEVSDTISNYVRPGKIGTFKVAI